MIVSKMYYHVNLHEVLNSFSTPNVWFLVHFGCDFVGEKRSVWNPFTKELEEFAPSPEPMQDRGYLAAPGHSRLKGNLKHMQYIVENSFPIRTWPTWFPFSTFAARKNIQQPQKVFGEMREKNTTVFFWTCRTFLRAVSRVVIFVLVPGKRSAFSCFESIKTRSRKILCKQVSAHYPIIGSFLCPKAKHDQTKTTEVWDGLVSHAVLRW